MDGVYRTIGSVMETTTAETMLMNSTVQATPPHHQVYYSVTTLYLKNDTGVAHYNFNAHRPISLIFSTGIAK